ncbi:transient receptor potential cation channel subfamily A member 1 homolog [Strongylocentrotus purpuratus]|uniref:Ion transport domain-containing protein n=1 Tax=Strongylocentrotus purpuratus TaxID=7668 RepID=A0A7M7T2Q7_STRPU|nr:transient receptor potential cation channel subfamily A member 1 homolog [Strongylocentrotus purpuratus]
MKGPDSAPPNQRPLSLSVSQSDDRDLLESKTKDESTLMHTLCKHGHHGIVQMLDKMCSKLLDCQNKRRLTPLHSACGRNQVEVATLVCDLLHLRREEDFHIGMEESGPEDPPSLLKYTAKKDAIDCLVVLLKRRKDHKTLIDLLKWISVERNLFKVLKALLNRSEEIELRKGQDDMMKLTRLCAEKGHTQSVLELVAWDKDMINKAHDGNSLIHLIAEKGHHQTTKEFLNLKNPDVQTNKTDKLGQTALHVAIQGGHRMTSEFILKTDTELAGINDNKKMTPLMYACKTGNIYIVKKLLEMLKEDQVEIGFLHCDENGLNCLDHAIDNGHEMIAVALLDQDNWRRLMTHATSGEGTKTTPMRKLISSMPGVGKFVLDKCIKPEPKLSVQPSDDEDEGQRPDSDVEIKVDFELLEDWFSEWMREGDDQPSKQKNGDYMAMTKRGRGTGDRDENKDGQASATSVTSSFNGDGKLKRNASIYVRDRLSRSENHPVHYLIENDESKKLLDHPVVRLMFRNKHEAFRLEYWPRFCLQLTLLVFLTLHSLIIPPPYYVKKHLSEGNYTWLADGEAKWKKDLDSNALVLFGSIGTWLILLLTVIYFFEFLQRKWVYRKPKSFSIAGWLSFIRELTLQILIILFVVPGFGDVYFGHGVTFKADWQWELGAYAVLLAWINFILFLQTAPFFGIYILMFIEVITTMVNFLLVAGIFICTFAVVFCILIINQTQYHTFWDSLAKSLTMLTGGIDFDTVFHPMDYLYQQSATEDFTNIVFYPSTTLVIFLIFLFSMPIVVMNLLTGLAVYDIDVIQKKAKIVKQTIEAEGILAVQNNMLPWVWKRSVLQHKKITVFKNVSSLTAICYKLTGYKDTHDYLVAFLEELGKKAGRVEYTKTTDVKIDNMMDKIDDVRNRLYLLSDETLDANTLHREAIRQVQDKLDKMCRGKVV